MERVQRDLQLEPFNQVLAYEERVVVQQYRRLLGQEKSYSKKSRIC